MFRQQQFTPARNQEMRPQKIPEPPLNPYMRFSRKNWNKARQENVERPLWDISRIVAQMWKDLSEGERNEYQQQYEHDRMEYEKVMKTVSQNYNNAHLALQKRAQKQANASGRRQEQPNPGVVIQPVIDEDPYEVTPRRLAAMRFERNQRLALELFNGQPMPDVRIFVAPQRIESLRKQGDNLDNHKRRITDEMNRADESFKQRKRAIEEDSEKFTIALQEASNMRPKVDEELYKNMVEEAEKKLLEQWEAYQKRQETMAQQKDAERKETPILYSLTVSPDSSKTTKVEENTSATEAMETDADAPTASPEAATSVNPNDEESTPAINGETEAPSTEPEIPTETAAAVDGAADDVQQNANESQPL